VRTRKTTRHGVLVALCAGVAICFLTGCAQGGQATKTTLFLGSEVARVTSPNGQLDAVIIREDGGGAAGGWEWYAYIVAKASGVDQRKAHSIFHAGSLTGQKLVWSQAHLLEIHYGIADIEEFRNLWGLSEIQNVGSVGERDYLVEIRLVPSADFSLLAPDGRFRR
jgi:hypothetical protein